jgi:glycosyltransferase involved in cell wall biosynthesis
MSSPRVSILLPCLNARSFLKERVESILAQSFSDWEAIVLDSHSTDGSWEFFESIATRDHRFRLHRLPREGLYAALNRGIELATGEFLHVATCDDTMDSEFLATLLDAFAICPEAGIAACDLTLINARGKPLTREDMTGYLSPKSIKVLLSLAVVRSYPPMHKMNYRTPPHDCLLHFSTKSVYLSLSQLLFRSDVARANGPFDTTVEWVADLGWLARLTNLTGTVHTPAKLAMWRFHGNQLSIQPDNNRLHSLEKLLQRAATEAYQLHEPLLTRNDCAALLLPCERYLADSVGKRLHYWLEILIRSFGMLRERPLATLSAMIATRFWPGNVKKTFVPMFMRRLKLSPRELQSRAPGRREADVVERQSLPKRNGVDGALC